MCHSMILGVVINLELKRVQFEVQPVEEKSDSKNVDLALPINCDVICEKKNTYDTCGYIIIK